MRPGNPTSPATDAEAATRRLYLDLLTAWNRRDAEGFAALFDPAGSIVGFDGSQVDGAAAISAHLAPIFASHPTAPFAAIVRECREIVPGVVLLRAVAGMVPVGERQVKPERNAVQSVVAAERGPRWRIALFQNTPAAWHGRPEESRRLTEELQAVADRGRTVE